MSSVSYPRKWLAEFVALDSSEREQWGVANRECQTVHQLLSASRQPKWVLYDLQPPTEAVGRTWSYHGGRFDVYTDDPDLLQDDMLSASLVEYLHGGARPTPQETAAQGDSRRFRAANAFPVSSETGQLPAQGPPAVTVGPPRPRDRTRREIAIFHSRETHMPGISLPCPALPG